MHSHWDSKKIARVHDLARDVTSLTKIQIDSRNAYAAGLKKKTEFRRVNCECRGSHANNIDWNSFSSMKLSCKNPSSPRSPPTSMPIWRQHHQHLQHPQQADWSFSPKASTTSIYDAPYCLFRLVPNRPSTQCPDIPLQLCARHINKLEANPLSIAIHPRWNQSN